MQRALAGPLALCSLVWFGGSAWAQPAPDDLVHHERVQRHVVGARYDTGARAADFGLGYLHVHEARDWSHGTFLGSIISSEKTAAANGTVGELRRDPMAMLPFCGYNMADYWTHWLRIGERPGAVLPRIFYVNWFRKDANGRWLWPGYGENSRVLKWVFERVTGTAKAVDTPIGRLGSLSCGEHFQPLLKSAMYSQFEQVHVAAWPAFSLLRGRAYLNGPEAATMASQIYAIEGQCFVLCATTVNDAATLDIVCQTEEQRRMLTVEGLPAAGGRSNLFGPDGAPLAQYLPEGEEGLVFAEIDLAALHMAKTAGDTLVSPAVFVSGQAVALHGPAANWPRALHATHRTSPRSASAHLQFLPWRRAIDCARELELGRFDDGDLGRRVDAAAGEQMATDRVPLFVGDGEVQMTAVPRRRSGQRHDLEMATPGGAGRLIGEAQRPIGEAARAGRDEPGADVVSVAVLLHAALKIVTRKESQHMRANRRVRRRRARREQHANEHDHTWHHAAIGHDDSARGNVPS